MIDAMARRYGKLPHEILHQYFPDYLFDLYCHMEGAKHDRPQPVVLVK